MSTAVGRLALTLAWLYQTNALEMVVHLLTAAHNGDEHGVPEVEGYRFVGGNRRNDTHIVAYGCCTTNTRCSLNNNHHTNKGAGKREQARVGTQHLCLQVGLVVGQQVAD